MGYLQLCEGMIFAATPPYDGTLARYYKLPADIAYRLGENMTLEDGAMVGSCDIKCWHILIPRLD